MDEICGHINLRHHDDEYRYHRVLLGMGVDEGYRQQGLGSRLVAAAVEFCQKHDRIDWLDLQVLGSNMPANYLYVKLGFNIIGKTVDCYRIDGQSISETMMALSSQT